MNSIIIECHNLKSSDIENRLNSALKDRKHLDNNNRQIIVANKRHKRENEEKDKKYHVRYSGIQFENNVLKTNSVYIERYTYALILERSNIRDIESGAFGSKNNIFMRILELHDLNMDSIKSEAFENLGGLFSLRITRSKLKTIDTNTLHVLRNLNHLMIYDCPNLLMSFDKNPKFFGSFSVLHTFSASGNDFGTAINKFTFNGFLNIIEIHLPSNKIKAIGAETFTSSPFASLKRIVLSDNQLKTIPFSIKHFSAIDIDLNSNHWHCDCGMEPFRKYIQTLNDPEPFSGMICHSPPNIKGKRLIDCSDLCVKACDFRGVDIVRNQFFEKLSCNQYRFNLDNFSSNFVIIEIEDDFDHGGNQRTVNCYTGKVNENRLKLDVKPNRAHHLCRLGDQKTFSPFDCKPFPACIVNVQNIWIDLEHRMSTIILSALIAISSFLLGFTIISLYDIQANSPKSDENTYSVIKNIKRCNINIIS